MAKYLLIDTHVHMHKKYNLDNALDSAWTNFSKQSGDSSHENYLGVLFIYSLRAEEYINSEYMESRQPKAWAFKQIDKITIEARSLQKKILIKTGYQVVSNEGIEVLVQTNNADEFFGEDTESIIEKALDDKLLIILPWGVGKWLGRRGKIINRIISKYGSRIFLGDNSARPWFWRNVAQFKLAKKYKTRILPGTDPLSISGEEKIIGTCGIRCEVNKLNDYDIIDILTNRQITSYGQFESAYRFFYNQFKLRVS